MKVLHIGKYFPPYRGGMETYLRDLMAALKPLGIECSALVHRSEISYRSTDEQYSVDGTSLPVTRAAVWARLLFTPLSPTFPFLLHKLIKRDQPDVLHLHMPNVSVFWALLLPSSRRIPWIVHWHSDVLASEHSLGLRIFYRVYRPLESAILRRSASIVATSPPYLEASEPLASFRDKCAVVPLGIRPQAVVTSQEPERSILDNQAAYLEVKEPGEETKVLQVLAVGRLAYYKGFQYLIEAIAKTPDIQLDLVGAGEKEAELRSLAAKLNITERITFRGATDDEELGHLMDACDCLCLPSIERTEAFGLVLLEAMSHGKAVIASQLAGSGIGWVVDDGVTGLQVPPADAGALANCLRILQRDRDKITYLGRSGQDRYIEYFHINKSAVGVAEVYQQVDK
ncbi:MAG: glycosyltransferase [Halioglobus sp.]